jgi:putative transposase
MSRMRHRLFTQGAGIFSDRDALVRLIGAVLAEQHNERTEGRHLGLDVLARCRLWTTIDAAATDNAEEVTIPTLST